MTLACDGMTFEQRLKSAQAWQRKDPGYSTCWRCHMPWSAVSGRSVSHPTLEPRRGSCALCISCWDELGTAEARLPYYLMLPTWWATMSDTDIEYENKRLREGVEYESTHPQQSDRDNVVLSVRL